MKKSPFCYFILCRKSHKPCSGNCEESIKYGEESIKNIMYHLVAQHMDYRHMKARYIILCGPNSNDWTKMGANSSAENTPNAPKLSAQFVCTTPKVLGLSLKNGFIGGL